MLPLQDWPALAPAAARAIASWEGEVEARHRPAMESRYTAAWRAGDTGAASRILVSFTSAMLQQAGAMLEALAHGAARQLGLPGTPPDERLVDMLGEAAELYAFEPTSDNLQLAVCRQGDKRLRACVGSCVRRGSQGGSSGSLAAEAAVLRPLYQAATE